MEEGTGPFLKPWDARVDLGLPMNATTGKSYRGGNLLHLWALQSAWDTQDNRWMTYKQAAAVGAQVRKGEKASVIEYWDWSPVEEAKKSGDPDLIAKAHPKVFFPGCSTRCRSMGCRHWSCHPASRARYPSGLRSGAQGQRGRDPPRRGNQAFYRPMNDSIHLPHRNTFHSASGYYATALHELGHWTGFPTRLHRDQKGPLGASTTPRKNWSRRCRPC